MKASIIVSLLAIAFCFAFQDATGATWQELIDRADSLAAVGEVDSVAAIIDAAISKAVNQYGESDTTVNLQLYRDGIAESYYFSSYAEAESLFTRALRIMDKIDKADDRSVVQISNDLAEVYLKQNKFSDAEVLFRRALSIRESGFGPKHLDVAASLTSLGSLFEVQGRYAEAEPLFERALGIREKLLEPEHPKVATSLNNMAIIYWRQDRYIEAKPLFERALAIQEKVLGPEHPDVATTLNGLANLCGDQEQYEKAEQYFLRALAIREKAFGPESDDVASILINMAFIYRSQGRYVESGTLFDRALSILEKALGPEHPDVALIINNQAILHAIQAEYDEAERLFKQALEIQKKAFGPVHPEVARGLNNLAVLYYRQARFAEVCPLLEQSLAINEQIYGPEHSEVAGNLLNLASMYDRQGRYSEAEPMLKRAIAIWEKIYGPEHSSIGLSLTNLANIYKDAGRYAEAEPLYKRVSVILEKALGPEHHEVASNLNNLALLYQVQGKYSAAEPLYEQALAIKEKAFGKEHPEVASTMSNLAINNFLLGKYAEAESLYSQTLAIQEKVFGPENLHITPTLNNLGLLYEQQDKYSEALAIHERVLAIRENDLGPNHHETGTTLLNIAVLYQKQGKYSEAEELLERVLTIFEKSMGENHHYVAQGLEAICKGLRLEDRSDEAMEYALRACRIRQKNFADNANVLSENDALTYSMYLRNAINLYLSCYFELPSRDSETINRTADIFLSRKGQVSDGIFERRKALVQETDSTTLALAEALRFTKFQLSRLFVEGPGEDMKSYRSEVDSLSKLANEQEADLSRHSISFREQQDLKNINVDRISSLLPRGAVFVEYLRYEYISLKPDSVIPRYLVVIVNKDKEPVIMDLGRASDIDPLVGEYRQHMLSVAATGKMPDRVAQFEYMSVSEGLYRRIWRMVEEYAAGKDLVLIAPDGALNMVSFTGLIDDDGRYLIEKYPIHYLSSGRDLIRLKEREAKGRGLFALGDPDYNAPPLARASVPAVPGDTIPEPVSYAMANIRSACGELEKMRMSPLPGTRKEVEAIAARWEKFSDEPAVVCFGSDASEERFKADAPGSRIIHLATHGYFLESTGRSEILGQGLESDIRFVGESPLLLSGLFLAGANLHGEGADSLGMEDGILTAYEVSAMDLEGTELVVLSACETGLGEVREGEGVYGLRRAFQMAGARIIISALWPVSDEMTADMIGRLYEEKSEFISATMHRIQLEKIAELRSQGKVDHPCSWGAFITLGDWR